MQRRLIYAAIVAALPGTAIAHSPMSGIGEFYGGILHPVLVLSHLLPLLVLALLLGQGGVQAMRLAYPAFMVALIVGLFLAGFEVQPALPNETILLVGAMLCGLLVAAQRPLPATMLAILAGAAALVIGMDSGVTGLDRRETFSALAGCWLGAVLVLLAVAGVTEMTGRHWQKVAVRVLGSWITASAALVLALALRPPV